MCQHPVPFEKVYAASLCHALDGRYRVDAFQIAPSITQYLALLTQIAKDKSDLGVDCEEEKGQIEKLTKLLQRGAKIIRKLHTYLQKSEEISQLVLKTRYMQSNIIPTLKALRATADVMEQLCPANLWSMPTYSEMLFDNSPIGQL